MVPRLALGVLVVASGLCVPQPVRAMHTVFSYGVDLFELDGNQFGPIDDVPGFVDHFDDGAISDWGVRFGTAFESGTHLFLTSPGTHFPSPDGTQLDLTIVAGHGLVYDGRGDFVATAFWQAAVPPPGHHFHLSLYTGKIGTVGAFNEIFGVGIQNLPSGFGIEQHRTEIDLANGIFRNTFTDVFPLDPEDIAGPIGFRIVFDDTINVATTAFSVDGGATWVSPFAGAWIFVGRDIGQFILSADPASGSSVVTTTTTNTSTSTTATTSTTTTTTTTTSFSTTTTTTTIGPPAACDPTGCRGTTEARAARLLVRDKRNDHGDRLVWRLRKGQATTLADFGVPANGTQYSLCIGSGPTRLLETSLPPAGRCGRRPCWRRVGPRGYRYEDRTGRVAGIRLVTLQAGPEGETRIAVEAKGAATGVPTLPASLPITVRLSADHGPCWAATFSETGVRKNTPARLLGDSD